MAAVAHDFSVLHAHVGQRSVVDGHESQGKIRNIFRHHEADVHRHNALTVFNFFRRGAFDLVHGLSALLPGRRYFLRGVVTVRYAILSVVPDVQRI